MCCDVVAIVLRFYCECVTMVFLQSGCDCVLRCIPIVLQCVTHCVTLVLRLCFLCYELYRKNMIVAHVSAFVRNTHVLVEMRNYNKNKHRLN